MPPLTDTVPADRDTFRCTACGRTLPDHEGHVHDNRPCDRCDSCCARDAAAPSEVERLRVRLAETEQFRDDYFRAWRVAVEERDEARAEREALRRHLRQLANDATRALLRTGRRAEEAERAAGLEGSGIAAAG